MSCRAAIILSVLSAALVAAAAAVCWLSAEAGA